MHHFLSGGAPEIAGRLVAQSGHALIEEERVVDLERWLGQLPGDVIERDPTLLLFKAWMARVKLQIPEIAKHLKRAEALMSTNRPAEAISDTMRGYLNSIRSYERYLMLDHEESQVCAKRAITLIPPKYSYMRGFAKIIYAATLQMTGRFQEAVSVMDLALADPSLQRSHNQAVLLAGHSPICMMEADFQALRKAATNLVRLGKETGLPPYRAWGRLYLACSHYQCNEPETAERILALHMEDRYLIYPDAVVDGAVILSLSYQVLGRPQEARDVADSLNEFAMDTGNGQLLQAGQAFQAELALRQERLGEAMDWARAFEPRQFHAHYFFYLPELTLAKVLMAEDTPDSRQRARNLLANLEEFSRSTCNYLFLIPVLALQAILHEKAADESAALKKLAESVSLAEPGGGLRWFLDQGLPMADLFKRLQKQNVAVDYIEKTLAAFSADEQVVVLDAADHPIASHHQPLGPYTGSQPLVEPLTNRELDVLELLAQRLQNKEIADNLFVSTETVKGHLKNIYQKLNVGKRREAIEKAKKIGILPGDV